MYFVGNGGFGWASSFTGISGYAMAFDCDAIYSNNNYNRANGFQLRCLQE
ncbi:MAG: hypothetical protein K2G93_04225 [Rikenella sp.]|nr:hypothetical protein [Rikenella sp.]